MYVSFPLKNTEHEKCLGIYIAKNFKWNEQCKYASSKANAILGTLKRCFISRYKEIWKNLYKSCIRLNLEYASPVWDPYYKNDINSLECKQDKVTKMITEIRNRSPLDVKNLTSLHSLIEFYKK